MKLSELTVPTTTTMQVRALDGSMTDVYITGHTPDSSEWRKAAAKQVDRGQNTTILLGKKGQNKIEVKNDPDAHKKKVRLLASVVTDISGLDDWEFSPEAVLAIFENDGCAHIVEQWEEHCEDRTLWLGKSEKPQPSTSKSSRG